MTLQQLRQFAVLADTLNFRRAAERLHMAQPPLSNAIRKLEDELGITLFHRDPGNLRLSETGRTLQSHARRVLRDVDELKRYATEFAKGVQGRLVFGFSGACAEWVLPDLVPRFQAQYPRVELTLRESSSQGLMCSLAARKVDVAAVFTPLLDACSATLMPLAEERFVLALHGSHPLAQRDYLSLADLAAQPLIVCSRAMAPAMHAHVTMAFAQQGLTPRLVQEYMQVSTALRLAECGIGAALVPSSVARSVLTQARLVPVLDLPAIGIALAWDPDTARGPAQRLIEVAADMVRERAATLVVSAWPLPGQASGAPRVPTAA